MGFTPAALLKPARLFQVAQVPGCSRAADHSTKASMIESTSWPASTVAPASSAPGGSKASNCDRSSAAGMKWPDLTASRPPMSSGEPLRYKNWTLGQCARSWSRYLRLSAEQLATPPSRRPANHSPTLSSQGWRSSSLSGSPAVILAMLACGCRVSASTKGTRSRCASAAPTVDLPDPETPITTTGDDAASTRRGFKHIWYKRALIPGFLGCFGAPSLRDHLFTARLLRVADRLSLITFGIGSRSQGLQ